MLVNSVVDLSIPLGPGTPVYPGDPPVRLHVHSTIATAGFNLLGVSMGSQSGTHVDAPYHFEDDGARVDELDLRLFAGPGVVVDARDAGPRGRVLPHHLAPVRDLLAPGAVVLLATGWTARSPAERLDHPFLDAATCRVLLGAGVRTVGIDALSVDETPDAAHPGEGYPVHHLVARAGGVVVENLVGLDRVAGMRDPLVCVFPLRLEGADGAPARAVALELGPARRR